MAQKHYTFTDYSMRQEMKRRKKRRKKTISKNEVKNLKKIFIKNKTPFSNELLMSNQRYIFLVINS